MECPPGMPGMPSVNLSGLVRRGIVENDIYVVAIEQLPYDGVKECDEFLIPNPCTIHLLLFRVTVRYNRLKTAMIFGIHGEGDTRSRNSAKKNSIMSFFYSTLLARQACSGLLTCHYVVLFNPVS